MKDKNLFYSGVKPSIGHSASSETRSPARLTDHNNFWSWLILFCNRNSIAAPVLSVSEVFVGEVKRYDCVISVIVKDHKFTSLHRCGDHLPETKNSAAQQLLSQLEVAFAIDSNFKIRIRKVKEKDSVSRLYRWCLKQKERVKPNFAYQMGGEKRNRLYLCRSSLTVDGKIVVATGKNRAKILAKRESAQKLLQKIRRKHLSKT